MGKSIGIDLGTTNSVAAIKRVHTEVLKNAEGDYITPSCVAVTRSKILGKPSFIVGKDAVEWMKQDPQNTITTIKRLMGRNFQDKEVQEILSEQKLPYKIDRHSRGTENSIAVFLNGKEYTPEEISSKILGKISADVGKALKDTVEYAVITVPAYFNDKQKHATRTAAALAGLKVRRLLPEPTAAAVSFGVDTVKGDDASTVLVFDFGGGTFDLSILTISAGQFIEQGKGGDMWMGGEDIDRMLMDYILKQTAKENEIEDFGKLIEAQDAKVKNRFIGELKARVEHAKIHLTEEENAYIEIIGLLKDEDGDPLNIDIEITRTAFEDLISPIVQSTVKLTQKLLQDVHFTPDLIDKVLLVGGSSKIPAISNALKQLFGEEKVLIHERPMLAISEGAAILCHRLSDVYECPKCSADVAQADKTCPQCGFDLEQYTIDEGVLDIVHSTAHDYYIGLENDKRHLLIEKNTPLPCEVDYVFKLVHTEQQLIHLKFYNIVNEMEESIGDLWLGFDFDEREDDPKTPYQIEINLAIDENNIAEVKAVLKEHPEIALSKTLSRGKTDEQLFQRVERMIDEANKKGYSHYVMMDMTYRTLSIIKDLDKVIQKDTETVDEKQYKQADNKIEKAIRMAAENKTSKPTIYYATAVLDDFGVVLPNKVKSSIRNNVEKLEDMDERGTYEENVKALDDLANVLNNKLGVVNLLMQIQKAGDYCTENNPAKAPKYYQAIKNILDAFKEKDEDKAYDILKGIMPEANQEIRERESRAGKIYKDITA